MPKVYFLSDRAIQIDWHEVNSSTDNVLPASELALYRQVLSESIQAKGWPACQCIQADQSITVLFACSMFANGQRESLAHQMNRLVQTLDKSMAAANHTVAHHHVVVNYGGVAGQDLAWLAGQTGLSPSEIIDLHSGALYTVQFLGFLPGFAYLTGLPKQLHFPRRATPRKRVPAGTLAIGAHYCAVYPWESPGGWHLLGHVEQVLFDPDCNAVQGRSVFRAGDTVQFIRAEHA